MKIAFFWTWEFSKNILKDIIENKYFDVLLTVSQQDKPYWRKMEITPTPVKLYSIDNNLNIIQPEKLKNNIIFFDQLRNLNLDFIVVVAYWKIIPKEILEIPKHWCINIHGSILPKYRWASPIQEAIKSWDEKTWLTIMYMSEKMDEWDILAIKEVNIDILDKTFDIFKKFEELWAKLLYDTLLKISSNQIKSIKQDESLVTYCSKIDKKFGEINWNKETAKNIYDKYRAYNPWPWVYTYFKWKKLDITDCFYYDIDLKNEENIKIWDVVEIENENFDEKKTETKNKKVCIICKEGVLILKKIKLEWKKEISIKDFINGNKDFLNYNFK